MDGQGPKSLLYMNQPTLHSSDVTILICNDKTIPRREGNIKLVQNISAPSYSSNLSQRCHFRRIHLQPTHHKSSPFLVKASPGFKRMLLASIVHVPKSYATDTRTTQKQDAVLSTCITLRLH